MKHQRVFAVAIGLVALMACGGVSAAQEYLEDDWLWELPPTAGEDVSGGASARSIAEELQEGLKLLEGEIAKEQQALPTAQTERERQLMTEHIRTLKQEHASLEKILYMLVGPAFDVRAAAKEQQAELRYEREQKILEQDQRFPAQ